ncbi:hypothetical protein PMAYCL1PPCAC_05782, partial [Pristionchus mayeri]
LGYEFKNHILIQIRADYPVETRSIEISDVRRTVQWIRIQPQYHSALTRADGFIVVIFLSEMTMAYASLEIYNKAGIEINSYASLDQSVWIHETNINPCGWFLSVTDCEIISCGRALQRSALRRCSKMPNECRAGGILGASERKQTV